MDPAVRGEHKKNLIILVASPKEREG
jgi:hypothetical protein